MRGTVLGVLIGLVLGFAAAQLSPASRDKRMSSRASDREMPLSEEVERLREELAEERSARQRLEYELERLKQGKVGTLGQTSEGDESKRRIQPIDPRLEGMDWEPAAEGVIQSLPLLVQIAEARAAGGEPPPERIGELVRAQAPLVALVLTLAEKDIPASSPNGTFSHPAVQVEMIRETLARANLSLTGRQEEDLRAMALRFAREDERRLASYGAGVWESRKLLEETQLRDRFYDEVDRLLTTEQRLTLHPPQIAGRTALDMFSGAAIWAEHVKGRLYADRAELAERMTRKVIRVRLKRAS